MSCYILANSELELLETETKALDNIFIQQSGLVFSMLKRPRIVILRFLYIARFHVRYSCKPLVVRSFSGISQKKKSKLSIYSSFLSYSRFSTCSNGFKISAYLVKNNFRNSNHNKMSKPTWIENKTPTERRRDIFFAFNPSGNIISGPALVESTAKFFMLYSCVQG